MTAVVKNKSTLVGEVVSNKMDKSIVVLIQRRVKHPVYGKYIQRTTKLCVHDEENACQMGDMVRIEQTRPLSKRKSWRLVSIEKRSELN